MVKFSVPLYVMLPRKTKADKKIILNLNTYIHINNFELNNAKIAYSDIVKKAVEQSEWCGYQYTNCEVKFIYYAASRRRVDKSNPLCIIEKFVCDALTDIGMWEDDDSIHIPRTVYEYGGVDKENPRCDVIISLLYGNDKEYRC